MLDCNRKNRANASTGTGKTHLEHCVRSSAKDIRRYWNVSSKGHEDDVIGAPDTEEEAEIAGTGQLGEEKPQGIYQGV
ncbi:hypothetical protein DUI87_28148 [Hirundo rustica rustica]|uniref:Uncharacterized protein n=1 Tax=Hirundo rustica rustica TaxID=333673 RepID=A0A3M0J3P7_HIRRU|nr:hypothetical protein DUI87_28148 [Hirundo rustica rustica]